MTTEKLVNNALFGKTELASSKVELGLTQNIEATLKQIIAYLDKANKADTKIQKLANDLSSTYKEFGVNINYPKNVTKTLDGYNAQLEKLSKELGVDVKGTPVYKAILDAYEFADQVNDTFMNMKAAISSIGK
jgi:adenine-specific DNA methylase